MSGPDRFDGRGLLLWELLISLVLLEIFLPVECSQSRREKVYEVKEVIELGSLCGRLQEIQDGISDENAPAYILVHK